MVLFVGVLVPVVIVVVALLVAVVLFVGVLVPVVIVVIVVGVRRMHGRVVVAVDERHGSSGRHELEIPELLRALHLLGVRLQAQPVVHEHVGGREAAHLPRARLPVVRVGAARYQLHHLRVVAGHALCELVVREERGVHHDLLRLHLIRPLH